VISENVKKRNASVKLIAQYQELFKTDHGKIILKDLLKETGVFHGSYSDSPQAMAYNEGKRSVGLRLIQILKMDHQKLNAILAKIDKDMEENQGDNAYDILK